MYNYTSASGCRSGWGQLLLSGVSPETNPREHTYSRCDSCLETGMNFWGTFGVRLHCQVYCGLCSRRLPTRELDKYLSRTLNHI
jgi:hypothetical protein